jgi:hypothetical protein
MKNDEGRCRLIEGEVRPEVLQSIERSLTV